MTAVVLGFLEGFWTWQTPVSFLAGVGAAQLYWMLFPRIEIKLEEDEDHVQEER